MAPVRKEKKRFEKGEPACRQAGNKQKSHDTIT